MTAHPLAFGTIGLRIARYGVVLLLAWIGVLKFLDYEAKGVQFLMSNHPLMSWIYSVAGTRTVSALVGTVEILTASMIALRPWRPGVSLMGGLMASGIFSCTLTFILTTPGAWEEGYGFPALTLISQFLLKDLVLLGVSLWISGDSRRAMEEAKAGGAA